MIKRFLSILLAVLLTAAALPLFASAESTPASGTIDSLSWTFDSATGKLTITGSGKMKNYNGSSLKSPFHQHNDIKSLEIGEGITNVGDYAFFQCLLLRDVSLPTSMETIGKGAFAGTSSLVTIDLPLKVSTISQEAFSAAGLVNMTIGKNVTSIGTNAFRYCKNLTGFTVLGDGSKFTNDDAGALFACEYGMKTRLLQYPCGSRAKAYIVPDTVTEIGSAAFEGNPYLEAVLIPASVEKLGNYCFCNCTALADVGMGSGVKNIGTGAFRGCTMLWDVYVEGGETFFDTLTVGSDNEPLQNSNPITECEFGECGDKLIWFYDGIDKVLSILGEGETDAFDYDMNPAPFSNLDAKKAVIGKSVSAVSDWAFFDLKDLEEIAVEEGSAYFTVSDRALYDAKKTRLIAFPNNTNVLTLRIPEGVAEIAPGAAGKAEKLFQVFLPESLKTVGYGAFEYCEGLKEVYYAGTELKWNKIEIGDANDPLLTAKRWYTIDGFMLTFAAPAVGEAPLTSYLIPAHEGMLLPYKVKSVAWTPADVTFQTGREYTVSFLISPKEGYRLPENAEDLTVTLNGKPAQCKYVTEKIGAVTYTYVELSYTFPALTGVEYTLGDVNGKDGVTAADARLALRAAVGLEVYEKGTREFLAADVNLSDAITAADARLILRKAVGMVDPEWGVKA